MRRRLAAVATAALLSLQCGTVAAADAPYVPTPMKVVDVMLEMAGAGASDYVIDLGSGDGRIPLRASAKFGARSLGVEIDEALVRKSRAEAARLGVSDKAAFEARNLFDTDISGATVLTTYLFQSMNLRLRPFLLARLKPGTRVVTHEFHFGSWQPDRKVTVEVPEKPYGEPRSDVMLWIVPADMSGIWQVSAAGGEPQELRLDQKFQMLGGELRARARVLPVSEGRISGNMLRLVFAGGTQIITGRLEGDAITGELRLAGSSQAQPWRARRVQAGKMDIDAGSETPFSSGQTFKEQ